MKLTGEPGPYPVPQWKHDWPEVEGWFRDAGLEDIRRHEVAVSVSGRRPQTASAQG